VALAAFGQIRDVFVSGGHDTTHWHLNNTYKTDGYEKSVRLSGTPDRDRGHMNICIIKLEYSDILMNIQDGDAMNKQLADLLKYVADCRLVSLLQVVSVVSFTTALHTAIAHQGELPAALYVLWVVATAIVATLSLAISSSCELDAERRDRLTNDEPHGAR
jgi:hypothetical protein